MLPLIVWGVLSCLAGPCPPEAPKRVMFLGVTVVDVEKGTTVLGRAVVVSEFAIKAVEPAKGYLAPARRVRMLERDER